MKSVLFLLLLNIEIRDSPYDLITSHLTSIFMGSPSILTFGLIQAQIPEWHGMHPNMIYHPFHLSAPNVLLCVSCDSRSVITRLLIFRCFSKQCFSDWNVLLSWHPQVFLILFPSLSLQTLVVLCSTFSYLYNFSFLEITCSCNMSFDFPSVAYPCTYFFLFSTSFTWIIVYLSAQCCHHLSDFNIEAHNLTRRSLDLRNKDMSSTPTQPLNETIASSSLIPQAQRDFQRPTVLCSSLLFCSVYSLWLLPSHKILYKKLTLINY